MKINFTKKEYITLLEMIDIASWVISSGDVEKNPSKEAYDNLEQKIFSLYKEFDCEKHIEYSQEHDEYYPTHFFEMESPHRQLIDHYEEDSFWDLLIEKLVMVSIDNEITLEAYSDLPKEERYTLYGKHENRWQEELENHGLDRFVEL